MLYYAFAFCMASYYPLPMCDKVNLFLGGGKTLYFVNFSSASSTSQSFYLKLSILSHSLLKYIDNNLIYFKKKSELLLA